ncbi:MAG TPA: hypothetical protein VHU91_06210, partial [Mycobacteriales bacterium]|nr:hypothetical protein [Mycobacteriales bacterium]
MAGPEQGERRHSWALRRIAAARHRHMLSPPPVTASIEQLMHEEITQIRGRFAAVARQPGGPARREAARKALLHLLTSGHSYVLDGVVPPDSRRLGLHTDTVALRRRPFANAQAPQLSYLNSLVSAQLLQTLPDGVQLLDDGELLETLEPTHDAPQAASGTEIELAELVSAAPGFDAELGAIAVDRVIDHHRQLLGV